MTMMGASPLKRPGAADDLLALVRVISSDTDFVKRVEELERLKAEVNAEEARAEAARQSAEGERLAALEAAEQNSRRLLEIKQEQGRLDEAVAAFEQDKAGVEVTMRAEAEALQAGALRLSIDRHNLEVHVKAFGQASAEREADLAEKEEAVTSALEAAMLAREDAERARTEANARLARIKKAAIIAAEDDAEGR
jgi:hypothetical protein